MKATERLQKPFAYFLYRRKTILGSTNCAELDAIPNYPALHPYPLTSVAGVLFPNAYLSPLAHGSES